MSNNEDRCPICGDSAKKLNLNEYNSDYNYEHHFYECNTCGKYAIDDTFLNKIDKNKLASFLYYNNKIFNNKLNDNYFYYFIGEKNIFDLVNNDNPSCHLLRLNEIENWYPKDFSEKIDTILLGLEKLSDYFGDKIQFLNTSQLLSLFFMKRYVKEDKKHIGSSFEQITWLSEYFNKQKLVEIDDKYNATILPEGWKRIDVLQKNQSDSRQAFVAIAFSDDMKKVQEAIEEGIHKARYIPYVMNKSEHNNQIVPEILYQIKQSKFVVAEFSTKNNGAYYEAGYAAGLGKEVIHICKKSNFSKKGHFDIKQKSTILWKTEDEIAELLFKRIEATIGMGK